MATELQAPDSDFGKAVLSRVARRLLPLILICYVIAFIDRTNISIASLTMNQDIGLSDAAFGLGAGVFFIGYSVFEVPSNVLLAKLGARVWITRIMISWGIVTVLMMFVRDPVTFYLGRFLLGAAEAGFYPGMIYFLSTWFPAAARGRAFSLFQIGGPIGLIVGSPLAGSLLQLDGVLDLAGWQWVFIATGVPAVVAGVAFWLHMTDKPQDAAWLPEQQREWLVATMAAEQVTAGAHTHSFLGAMRHPIVWLISAVNFFIIVSLYGVSLWLPRIVQGFAGSSDFVTSLLSAVPYVAVVVAVLLVARHSDRTRERHLHVAVPCLVGAVALACTGLVTSYPALALAVLALASAGIYSAIPPMWGLPTAVLGGPAAAAAIGLISAIGNVGGFVGPSIAGFIIELTGEPASSLAAMGASLALAGLLVLALRWRAGNQRDAAATVEIGVER
jgi:MFS transporter, ACS family, tartrate transporter